METNILMESGTNELEVLEFMVGGNHYGINVAKIKEIVHILKLHQCLIHIQALRAYLCHEIL